MIVNAQKEIQAKLARNLLDPIMLQYLERKSMHGYELIAKIRKEYGIYLGPSTVYPLLNQLEKKGYVKSAWNMTGDRPKKEYTLTVEGKHLLKLTEDSLNLICRSLVEAAGVKEQAKPSELLLQESSQRVILCHSR